MTDEPIKPNPAVDTDALMAEIEALRKSKAEILNDLKKEKAQKPDVDVQALVAYKQQKEREELEAKGKYEEAMLKQAEQYRTAEAAKNKEIEALKADKRRLEVEAPAVSALADVVHDPQYVLSRLNKDQLSREPDGQVVVVDGYNRTPIKEWALSNTQPWMQKNARPQGGGAATATKINTDFINPGEKNPFSKEHFNITEQTRLYKTDINKYNLLKKAVSG